MSTGLPIPRDADQLRERIADACATLRLVPAAKNSRPAEMRSNWPDYLRDTSEAYGYQAANAGPTRASASAVARMDEVLLWVARWWSAASLDQAGLASDGGAVVWLHAGAGWKWPRIAEWRRKRYGENRAHGVSGIPMGNTPPSLRVIEQKVLAHMLRGLGAATPAAPHGALDTQMAEDGAVRLDVVLDRTMESRVSAMLGEGVVMVQTRHARASWQVIPASRASDQD